MHLNLALVSDVILIYFPLIRVQQFLNISNINRMSLDICKLFSIRNLFVFVEIRLSGISISVSCGIFGNVKAQTTFVHV